MKRALRKLIPILMILVIIASLIWYLTVYDPIFTRDTIMFTARTFDNWGHHSIAAWMYNKAYEQSGGGDDVAIELAEHYKSAGNYTKAEYTLTKAIADGGSLKLYVALCQIYVEQDKVLDAIKMIDQISNENIKAQLEAMRPKAPSFDPTPGFYAQYFDVNIVGEGEKVYANFNGEYPSLTTDLFTDPVRLPDGETTICAVTINEQNLVSPLAKHSYIIGGVIKEVEFVDEVLEAHIRTLLNFNETRPINTDDLWDITDLIMPEGVTSYEDLVNLPYLQKVIIADCSTVDLTPLSQLKELKTLTIRKGEISLDSMKAIGKLTGLEELTLHNCGLSTVTPFEGLVNLKYLDLSSNTLRNIEVFSAFTQLEELHMSYNALMYLDSLAEIKTLRVLDVSHNALSDLKPILGLTGLKTLKAANNAITSVEGLSVLANLEVLDMSENGIKDLSPLGSCTMLIELNMAYNLLTDISVMTNLTSVIRLDVSHNEIEDLPDFTKAHQLGALNIAYNKLKDIDELSVLKEIYSVDIDYNEEIETIDPLQHAHHITLVNCFGTKVVINPFGNDSGVVVNMDNSLYYDE